MTSTEPMTYKPGPDTCPFCFNTGNVQCDDGVFEGCPICEVLSALQHVSHTDGLGDRDEMDKETSS